MKPLASHEDQIGTAAVDLFASGMGAFILIAVIFMVLFAVMPRQEDVAPIPQSVSQPMAEFSCPDPSPAPVNPEISPSVAPASTCPPAPESLDCPAPTVVEVPQACPAPPEPVPLECPAPVAAQVCPACPICPTPQPVIATPAPVVESVEPPVPAASTSEATLLMPDYDIVFVLDSTGSMNNEIDSLKRELYMVVEVLERIMPSVGVGIVTFNDRLQSPAVRHYPVRRLTGDESAMREILRFVRDITAGDGNGPNPDLPEAVLQALRTAASTSFRPEVANRLIIVITDSYAYEDEEEQAFAEARSFAAIEGQRISTVHVQVNQDSERFLEDLAENGAGHFVPDRGSILANVMLSLL